MQNSSEKPKLVGVDVPHWMAELIREKAAERGLTANEMFEQLLHNCLELVNELEMWCSAL